MREWLLGTTRQSRPSGQKAYGQPVGTKAVAPVSVEATEQASGAGDASVGTISATAIFRDKAALASNAGRHACRHVATASNSEHLHETVRALGGHSKDTKGQLQGGSDAHRHGGRSCSWRSHRRTTGRRRHWWGRGCHRSSSKRQSPWCTRQRSRRPDGCRRQAEQWPCSLRWCKDKHSSSEKSCLLLP